VHIETINKNNATKEFKEDLLRLHNGKALLEHLENKSQAIKCCYIKGELAAALTICYARQAVRHQFWDRGISIEEIAYRSTFSVIKLLILFSLICEATSITCTVDQKTINMLEKAQKLMSPYFSRLVFNELENDLYSVECVFDQNLWPENLTLNIYKMVYFRTVFTSVIDIVYHYGTLKKDDVGDMNKYIKTAVRIVNQKNLSFMDMTGENFKMVYSLTRPISDAAIAKLKDDGFVENEFNKSGYSLFENGKNYRKSCGKLISYRPCLLDKKYFDGTCTYYRHVLKRHIFDFYIGNNQTTEACLYDRYGKIMLTFSTRIHSFLPRVNTVNVTSALKYATIRDQLMEQYNFVSDRYVTRIITDTLVSLYKSAGKDVSDFLSNRLSMILKEDKAPEMDAHDLCYPIQNLINPQNRVFLTKAVIKHIVHSPLNQIIEINNLVTGLSNTDKKDMDEKAIRKELSIAVRRKTSLKKVLQKMQEECYLNWFNRMKISDEVMCKLDPFIDRLKIYAPNTTAPMLYNMFGKKTNKMICGTYPGLFSETFYEPDRYELGWLVKECLGNKGVGAKVKNPKRLFKKLSKIQAVDKIIFGDIKKENVKDIISTLNHMGAIVPKSFDLLWSVSAKIERKCSPEFLIAGDATVCCMSLGADKAIDYAKHKGFGIFNVYHNGRIIANSVLWIAKKYNCLVLDNIEVHPNYTGMNSVITNLYKKMIEDIMEKYNLDFTVQGLGYSDLTLYEKETSFELRDMTALDVNPSIDFYSDAYVAGLVSVRNNVDFTKIFEAPTTTRNSRTPLMQVPRLEEDPFNFDDNEDNDWLATGTNDLPF